MSNFDIIRAWKDEAFRENLGEKLLLENPAGSIDLADELLGEIQGGLVPITDECTDRWYCTLICTANCTL